MVAQPTAAAMTAACNALRLFPDGLIQVTIPELIGQLRGLQRQDLLEEATRGAVSGKEKKK